MKSWFISLNPSKFTVAVQIYLAGFTIINWILEIPPNFTKFR